MSNTEKVLEAADLLAKHSKKAIKKYLIILFSGIALAFIPFLIMSWVGVETGSKWLIMLGGFWRVIFGIGVAIIFSLIAIPILLLVKGKEGPVIYMKAVLGAVLVALCTSLILMITPLTANPESVPIFIMCLIIGGIIITVNFNVKPIAWLVGIVFFFTFLSFFLPNKFSQAGRAIEDFDRGNISLPKTSKSIPTIPQLSKNSGTSGGNYRNYQPQSSHLSNQRYRENEKYRVPEEKKSYAANYNSNFSRAENKAYIPPTPAIIKSDHEFAVMISNSPEDSNLIAAALRGKGKDAIATTSISANLAKYIVRGRKTVNFKTDKTFSRADVIEAEVLFEIQLVDAASGKSIKSFQVSKKRSGLSRESAERRATETVLYDIDENLG